MRNLTILLAALLGTSFLLADDKARTLTFSKDAAGKLPGGWKADKTGEGEGSVWQVVADETSPSKTGFVLAQTAAGPSRLFNLCVVEDTSHKDLEASVKFKSVKGRIDQGGGLVWRYKDANNYYICRYNPLEGNVRVYKFVDGRRMQLQSKEDLDLPDGKWHTLTIRQVGDRIECLLNGEKYLDVKDDTFKDAGKVGLWTKADAVTSFDDLIITPR